MFSAKSLLFLSFLAALFVASAFADQCTVNVNCESCVGNSATRGICGWCESTDECLLGNAVGPGGSALNCTVWYFDSCPATDCNSLKSCSSCTRDSLCGWCQSTLQCVPGFGTAPVSGSCSNYIFSSSKCPSVSTTGRRSTTTGRRTVTTGSRSSTGTGSTGSRTTGTASTGTASTGTASTGTASTGTASTGTASTGTASTGTRSSSTGGSTGTRSSSTGSGSTGTRSSSTGGSTGSGSTGTRSSSTGGSTGSRSTGGSSGSSSGSSSTTGIVSSGSAAFTIAPSVYVAVAVVLVAILNLLW